MTHRWLAVLAICGFWTALGTACDSGQRRREPATPPTPAEKAAPVPARVAAIGDTASLAPDLRRAFDPIGFEPMPQPGPDDWLARHAEKPQSFEDYLRADKNVPSAQRNVIYLLPVGRFPASAPPLAQLATIVQAFFMLGVKTLPAVNVGT